MHKSTQNNIASDPNKLVNFLIFHFTYSESYYRKYHKGTTILIREKLSYSLSEYFKLKTLSR